MAICCVSGCTNTTANKSDISQEKAGNEVTFHKFPNCVKFPVRHRAWVKTIYRKGSRKRFIPTKFSFVCSEHFTENDFEPSSSLKHQFDLFNKSVPRKFLKKTSIPTLHLTRPVISPSPSAASKERSESTYMRKKVTSEAVDNYSSTVSTSSDPSLEPEVITRVKESDTSTRRIATREIGIQCQLIGGDLEREDTGNGDISETKCLDESSGDTTEDVGESDDCKIMMGDVDTQEEDNVTVSGRVLTAMDVNIEIKEEPLALDEAESKPAVEDYPKSLEVLYKKHFPTGIAFARARDLFPTLATADSRPPGGLAPVQQFNFPPLDHVWIKTEEAEQPAEAETDPLSHPAAQQDGSDVESRGEDSPRVRSSSRQQRTARQEDTDWQQSHKAKRKTITRRPVRCEYCSKPLDPRRLPAHLRIFHSGDRPFACDKCPERRATADEMAAHAALHYGPRPFFCASCDVRYSARSRLALHSRHHTRKGRRTCEDCGATFVTKQKYDAHRRTHTGERPYRCGACGATFVQEAHVREHAKAKHGGEKPHVCEVCGAKFSRSNHLAEHRRTHTGEKPFPCTQCDKRFSRRPHLVRHMATHSGDRPYACATCDSTFARRDDLERHVRVHNSDRRYPCTECGARFLMSHHLKAHRKLHLAVGARTWVCKTCNAEFSSAGLLSSHTRTVHKGKT